MHKLTFMMWRICNLNVRIYHVFEQWLSNIWMNKNCDDWMWLVSSFIVLLASVYFLKSSFFVTDKSDITLNARGKTYRWLYRYTLTNTCRDDCLACLLWKNMSFIDIDIWASHIKLPTGWDVLCCRYHQDSQKGGAPAFAFWSWCNEVEELVCWMKIGLI